MYGPFGELSTKLLERWRRRQVYQVGRAAAIGGPEAFDHLPGPGEIQCRPVPMALADRIGFTPPHLPDSGLLPQVVYVPPEGLLP